MLPSTSSKEGKRLRERLTEVGVLRETTRQDHFRGRVVQLYGRRTLADNQIKKGSGRHLYLPSPLVGVWNEAALKASSEVIVCEGLIDAMTFWCAGFRNVITAYGCNAADHLAALQYHGVKRVLIAFDQDEAVNPGAESVAGELLALGIEAWRLRLPQVLDANEYALKSGSPEKALGLALEQAAWMGHGTGPGALFSHEKLAPRKCTGKTRL